MTTILIQRTVRLLAGILRALAILILLTAILVDRVVADSTDTHVGRARAAVFAVGRVAATIALGVPVERFDGAAASACKLHLDAHATHTNSIETVRVARATAQTGQRRPFAYLVKRVRVAGASHHAQIRAERWNVEQLNATHITWPVKVKAHAAGSRTGRRLKGQHKTKRLRVAVRAADADTNAAGMMIVGSAQIDATSGWGARVDKHQGGLVARDGDIPRLDAESAERDVCQKAALKVVAIAPLVVAVTKGALSVGVSSSRRVAATGAVAAAHTASVVVL